jgi:uncharacterized repeat protein (TIGR01451 family)
MARLRTALVISLVTLLLPSFLIAPFASPVTAQSAEAVRITLTSSSNKAKIGDILEFAVQVENASADPIAGFFVALQLPDALNARAVNCPGNSSSETFCAIGTFTPGAAFHIRFYVEVGSKTGNGAVTANAGDSTFTVLASESVGPIKIVGSPKQR